MLGATEWLKTTPARASALPVRFHKWCLTHGVDLVGRQRIDRWFGCSGTVKVVTGDRRRSSRWRSPRLQNQHTGSSSGGVVPTPQPPGRGTSRREPSPIRDRALKEALATPAGNRVRCSAPPRTSSASAGSPLGRRLLLMRRRMPQVRGLQRCPRPLILSSSSLDCQQHRSVKSLTERGGGGVRRLGAGQALGPIIYDTPTPSSLRSSTFTIHHYGLESRERARAPVRAISDSIELGQLPSETSSGPAFQVRTLSCGRGDVRSLASKFVGNVNRRQLLHPCPLDAVELYSRRNCSSGAQAILFHASIDEPPSASRRGPPCDRRAHKLPTSFREAGLEIFRKASLSIVSDCSLIEGQRSGCGHCHRRVVASVRQRIQSLVRVLRRHRVRPAARRSCHEPSPGYVDDLIYGLWPGTGQPELSATSPLGSRNGTQLQAGPPGHRCRRRRRWTRYPDAGWLVRCARA